MNHITLLDLPVLPADRDSACGTNIVQEAYLADRDAIRTTDDLWAHLNKWKNLWLLGRDPTTVEHDPTDKTLFDVHGQTIVNWLIGPKESHPPISDDGLPIEVLMWMDLVLPKPLIRAFVITHKYQVGTDLGLVRLFLDPYPELEDKLRGEF